MATSLFKLVGSVFVDTDEANKSLSKTNETAKSTGVSFGEVAGKAAAIGTAVVAAAGAAVAGIANMAKETAAAADEIDKASIRMGISAEAYQEYAYAADLAGVSTSTLELAAKALEGTNINFDDAMDSIMALGTAEERSAKAAELFGDKVAYNLSPMIEQSAEDFYAAKQEAEELGLVLSDDTVAAGAELNDTFSKLEQSFTMIGTKLGAELMPVVQSVADFILEMMPTIQDLIGSLAPVFQDVFTQLVPPLMDLVTSMLPSLVEFVQMIIPMLSEIISAIIPIIIRLLETFLPIFMEIVEKLLPPLLEIIEAILPIFEMILDVIEPILDVVMDLLDPIAGLLESLAPLITTILTLISECLEPIMPLIKFIAELFGTVLGTAIKAVTIVIEGITTAIQWLVEKIIYLKDNWGTIWTTMGNKIKEVFEKIKTAIKTPINWIIEKLNAVFKKVNEVKIPDWVPGIGGKGFNIPLIPTLADGGLIDEGQMFVAREAGPELVGTYGSRNAVVNNQQIVEAVSAGVAKAVASVMGSNGDLASQIVNALNNMNVVATISDDEVFKSVRNSNREWVEMTGRSAFV